MKTVGYAVATVLSFTVLQAVAAENPVEVDATIAAIKVANPDLKALCQQGFNGIRNASGDAVRGLVMAGKIKGNPREVGTEAGQKIGRECRQG